MRNVRYRTDTTFNIVPGDVKPTITVTGAASNSHFSVVVSRRGEANMWDVYILRKGGSWTGL